MTGSNGAPGLPASYRPLSVAGGIRAAMGRDPGRIAVRHGRQERTYRDLAARIDRVSAWMVEGLGLEPGRRAIPGGTDRVLEIVGGRGQAGFAERP